MDNTTLKYPKVSRNDLFILKMPDNSSSTKVTMVLTRRVLVEWYESKNAVEFGVN